MELTGLRHILSNGEIHEDRITVNLTKGTSLGQLYWYTDTLDTYRYRILVDSNNHHVNIDSVTYWLYTEGGYCEPITIEKDGDYVVNFPYQNMAIGIYSKQGSYNCISPITEFNHMVTFNAHAGDNIYIIGKSKTLFDGSVVELIHTEVIYTEIDEPIGFDKLSVKMKRGDYHGMSVEYSDTTLGFHGNAALLIEDSYKADIDTQIQYDVLFPNGQTLYTGFLDLTTYTKKTGKNSVIECKVAEINEKTTFNNRVDLEIDLNTQKTVDGAALALQQNWQSIIIPMRHILYTNSFGRKTVSYGNSYSLPVTTSLRWIYVKIPLNKITSEFGSVDTEPDEIFTGTIDSARFYHYDGSELEEDKFGQDLKMNISGRIIIDSSFTMPLYRNAALILYKKTKVGAVEIVKTIGSLRNGRSDITFNIDNLDANDQYAFNVQILLSPDSGTFVYNLTIKEGTYFKMTMYDKLPDTQTQANMLLVHDALNIISQAISENALTVKSDMYAHKSSIANPAIDAPGDGALKALSNGYKIRGLFTDSQTERNMPLSFKDAIKSLNAMDCIGWGLSTEGGVVYVRVERWDWFYQNNVILVINNTNSKTRKIEPKDIITKINCGYKKYATSQDFNSIDSIHGERMFASTIKALSNDNEQLCEFIADNYAIEETRRAKYQVDVSEEFKYDENIFVFELVDTRDNDNNENFSIISTAYDVTGVSRPTELINAKLSPRHNAERWRGYLFNTNSSAVMRFISGTINYKAGYKVLPFQRTVDENTQYGLAVDDGANTQAENADIANSRSMLMAETMEIEYPISTSQYQAIKANPYGRVVVDGEYFWIKEFQYEFKSGLAKFTLIPQYIEPQN